MMEETENNFNQLITAVIKQACDDFIELNPYSTRIANEFYMDEGHAYNSAADFLFEEVPAFGDLGWTFLEACEELDIDGKKLRAELFKHIKCDPTMPTGHQMDLFPES